MSSHTTSGAASDRCLKETTIPTLSEYAKLANDEVVAGIFENVVTESQLARHLQFESFEGNSLVYNRENVLPTAATFAVGSLLTDTEPTFTKKTASLTEIYVQSPLDRFVMMTRGNVQSQEAALFSSMSKSIGRKIADLTITGEPESTTTQWEGLDSLVRSETRMMAMDDGVVDGPGVAETELTLDRLDAMIDEVEFGGPQILIMNKRMRRKLTSLSRASGSGILTTEINEFGQQVSRYSGIPIVIEDFITNSEEYNDSSTWASSTATSIFAVRLGRANQGYTIIHNGTVLQPDIQTIGIKESKNENLYRIVVYLQAITYSAKAVSALGGIDANA